MPALSPKVMVAELIDAIQQSGSAAAYVSESVRAHPRKFIVNHLGGTYSIWVYIWTLTHGGRVLLPDEYRIQLTSVPSPLPRNPDGITVLMGYHPDLKVFAGFDLRKHSIFTTGSPSVQVNISVLHAALQSGLSFATKDNDEVVIGVRPDQFLAYCINAESLHSFGAESDVTTLLTRAADMEEISEVDISDLTADRKRIIGKVARYSREANFRKSVLNAYDNRCAVTRLQLRLVEAAHILPVHSKISSDHVKNGIALSPTIHRAYDNCLIYLDEHCVMRLNKQKADELRVCGLDGGLKDFLFLLDKKVHLPSDINQRPSADYIIMANKHRRIPGYF